MPLLSLSCENGHVEVVRILIQNGAAVNYQEKVSYDMSMHCIEDMIQLVICHLCILSLQFTGWAPLHSVSGYGHPSFVELLIECTTGHLKQGTVDVR